MFRDFFLLALLQVYVKMVYGNFIGRDKYEITGTHDGGHFSGVPWVSALINGRGRYIDPNTGIENIFDTEARLSENDK